MSDNTRNMAQNFRKILEKNNENKFENKEYSKKDFDDTFTLLKANLKFLGIRLLRNDTAFNGIVWDCWYWFEFANAVTMAILITLFIMDAVRRSDYKDIFEIFKMIPCLLYLFMSITKSYKLVYNRPVFEGIVSELRDMWPQGSVSDEEHDILQKMLRQLKHIVQGYTYLNVVFGIMAFIPPYVELLKEILDLKHFRFLPFAYLLPFNPYKNDHRYLLMSFLQSWQGWVAMWMIVCGDLVLYVLSSHITAQFDLLSKKIMRFILVPVDQQLVKSFPLAKYVKGVDSEDISYREREEMQVNEMKQIIIRHNTLIRITQDLDNMYSFSLLIHFINASIIICFSGFCGVFIEELREPLFKSFFIINTGQTGLICWYGQRLMESSQGISDALYNSGWYTSSKKIMTYILIMMHRSQKEVRITTYGFSVISLTSFTTIVKTAWSYFTLMTKMYKG